MSGSGHGKILPQAASFTVELNQTLNRLTAGGTHPGTIAPSRFGPSFVFFVTASTSAMTPVSYGAGIEAPAQQARPGNHGDPSC
jgi:hypothetical protein